jgi:hypothetical protein
LDPDIRAVPEDIEPDMDPDMEVAEAEAAASPVAPDPETVAMVPDIPREARAIPFPTDV